MRGEEGAIEVVFIDGDKINFKTIGDKSPKGFCGSGIIDAVAALLKQNIINRTGRFISTEVEKIQEKDGIKRYIFHNDKETSIYISETDIENIITAKGAIYAAVKILLKRLNLSIEDIQSVYIAGGFGNYINIENAITIGLLPPLPKEKFKFVGNTSLKGAKMVALNQKYYSLITYIRKQTTYYDLMGAEDYVEEFQKAMFLPHTDIEEFKTI